VIHTPVSSAGAAEPPAAERARGSGPARSARSGRRILMIAPTSFFADYGCHVRILEEARALARLGASVTLVTYRNGRDVAGLDIRRTLPIPWRRGYEVGSSRHKLGFDLLLAAKVLPVALRQPPDIIHGHLHEGALIGGALARLLRRPLVFDFQGSLSAEMVDHGFLKAGGRASGAVRALERRINHLPDAILTSSHHAARHLREQFGLPAGRIHCLPDCVNADAFRPGLLSPDERAARLADLGVPPERRIVAYLGLLARHQGTDLLLLAAQQVLAVRPDAHFLVMGFPGTELYAAQARALGIADRVTFTGRVPYEEAPRMLSLGEVAVAPKISTTEGSGKLLNYMAMGLPTVAFDLPVSREYLVADGCYAPPGDAGAFALRILALLADPGGGRELGARLRRRAEAQYTWRRAGETILGLYDQLAPVAAPALTD
jgi:glycosyltransferase involved in cell wall biosynthesis